MELAFAISLVTAGVAVPYICFPKNSYLSVLGLVALIIGIRHLYSIVRMPRTEEERLWYLLEENPQQIVWIYSVTTQMMPFGFHLWDSGTMYFKLLDGDEITVGLPVQKLKMVSKFLNRLLPHASIGFSEERRALFEKDPKSLLK